MDKNVLEREKNKVVKIAHRNNRLVDHMSTLGKKLVRVVKNYLKHKYKLDLVGGTSLDFVAVNDDLLICCVQE